MKGAVYVMDEMQAAVANVASKLGTPVYYMFGHPSEIVQNLTEMTAAPSKANLKYPLVALFTDILVDANKDGFYGDARLTLIIATMTKPEYKAAQRLANNFKPILQPIKCELVDQISRVKQWQPTGGGELRYKEIEHYYWGKDGLYGSDGNIFNDFIDAIELRDVMVTIKPKICSTLKKSF